MSIIVGEAEGLRWFVLRCGPGKELALQKTMQARFGAECFVPVEKVRQHDNHGRFVWVVRCALSSYLFVRCTKGTLLQIVRARLNVWTMMQPSEDLRQPVIVPDRDMADFIRVAGRQDEKVVYLDPAKLDFKKGDRVRVIGGAFVGVEGYFLQIGGKHEKRVIIQLEGLIAVATAAIPASLVEKI